MYMNKSSIICLLGAISMHLSLVAGIAQADTKAGCSEESHYPLITKAELQELAQSKDAVIIDVNSKESYQKVHVPGAIHFGSHKKDFTSLLPAQKNAPIVAYCGGVLCTAWKKAAELACNKGYTNIRHYKEGIQGWVKSD